MTRKRTHRDGELGAELIELAIVLPILLLCFAAIVDFGFLFQRYEAVTNAAREGARLSTLPNYTVADIQSRVVSYLNAAGMTCPVPANCVTVNQSATRTLVPSGRVISVSEVMVTYPAGFSFIGPMAGLIGGSGPAAITLRATSIMRNEAAAGGS